MYLYLYAIYQRTQSESKSQRYSVHWGVERICMQSIKEHNLKANHNNVQILNYRRKSVCNLSKNTIWKQITTLRLITIPTIDLYAIYQRTQSESKSQLVRCLVFISVVCMQSIKEHNLKANHNSIKAVDLIKFLYAIYQRTQSESKSQPWKIIGMNVKSVCNLSKNTIWKQITTSIKWSYKSIVCMQSIKEHNLKANHNFSSLIVWFP